MAEEIVPQETKTQRYRRLHREELNARARERRKADPEKALARDRYYREKYREAHNERVRLKRAADPVAARERERARELNRRVQIKEQKAAKYQRDRESLLERNRNWRKRSKAEISAYNRAYYQAHKIEHSARLAVRRAIQRGILIKPDKCFRCGATAAEIIGHHHSYAPEHWLDVEWLCKQCHVRHHAEENANA